MLQMIGQEIRGRQLQGLRFFHDKLPDLCGKKHRRVWHDLRFPPGQFGDNRGAGILADRNLRQPAQKVLILRLHLFWDILHPKRTGVRHAALRRHAGCKIEAADPLDIDIPNLVAADNAPIIRGSQRFPCARHIPTRNPHIALVDILLVESYKRLMSKDILADIP